MLFIFLLLLLIYFTYFLLILRCSKVFFENVNLHNSSCCQMQQRESDIWAVCCSGKKQRLLWWNFCFCPSCTQLWQLRHLAPMFRSMTGTWEETCLLLKNFPFVFFTPSFSPLSHQRVASNVAAKKKHRPTNKLTQLMNRPARVMGPTQLRFAPAVLV